MFFTRHNFSRAGLGDDRRTRLVVIAQDLDHAELLGCFSALGLQARVIE
jgi:hypothetical protein